MRELTPAEEKLRGRFKEAVALCSDGNADAFARLTGSTSNGGYVREILKGKKPVRRGMIERVHDIDGMGAWFDELLADPEIAAQIDPPRPARLGGTLEDSARQLAAHFVGLDAATRDAVASILPRLATHPSSLGETAKVLMRIIPGAPAALLAETSAAAPIGSAPSKRTRPASRKIIGGIGSQPAPAALPTTNKRSKGK